MMRFHCTCGTELRVREEDAGRGVHRPTCGLEMVAVADEEKGGEAVAAAPERTSGKAIASLVLGVLSLGCSFFTGIPAVIVGAFALRQIGRSRGRVSGTGLAVAGVVL